METLKIDCMAETINGQPYEEHEYQNSYSSSLSSSQNNIAWAVDRIDESNVTLNVVADYIVFGNNFDDMVKNILGKEETVLHSQEYIENLPHRIVKQFCKELCQILLDEYERGPVASWDAGSNHIVTSIGSSSGHPIKGIKVYDPWHTIARMYDIGVITAKDLGVSEEEFNEHISWYKVKENK